MISGTIGQISEPFGQISGIRYNWADISNRTYIIGQISETMGRYQEQFGRYREQLGIYQEQFGRYQKQLGRLQEQWADTRNNEQIPGTIGQISGINRHKPRLIGQISETVGQISGTIKISVIFGHWADCRYN